jgi:hypothetical protein
MADFKYRAAGHRRSHIKPATFAARKPTSNALRREDLVGQRIGFRFDGTLVSHELPDGLLDFLDWSHIRTLDWSLPRIIAEEEQWRYPPIRLSKNSDERAKRSSVPRSKTFVSAVVAVNHTGTLQRCCCVYRANGIFTTTAM